MQQINEPWAQDKDFKRYTLWFIYACIIYSIIGFSWGALMGALPDFRFYVNHAPHGHLILLGHGHINLLGWVEMAIFGALYFIVPRLARRPIYSMRLVKVHFWMHNFGLLGMVVFFCIAGSITGYDEGDEATKLVNYLMRMVGMFGTLVLTANIIWGYNLYRTSMGWDREAV